MCVPMAAASVEQAMPQVQGDGGGLFPVAAADVRDGHGMAHGARAFPGWGSGRANLLDLETLLRLLQLRHDFPITKHARTAPRERALLLALARTMGV